MTDLEINGFNQSRLEYDNIDALVCPGCGCANLHQTHVNVACRTEDAPVSNLVMVNNFTGETKVTPNGTNKQNLSPRRQGASIAFQCEQCSVLPILSIIQHKGATYIGWAHPLSGHNHNS